jgi:hypothetical protein
MDNYRWVFSAITREMLMFALTGMKTVNVTVEVIAPTVFQRPTLLST